MLCSKVICGGGIDFSGEESTTLFFWKALTLNKHSSRPNEVHQMSFFVHMLYFSGFP